MTPAPKGLIISLEVFGLIYSLSSVFPTSPPTSSLTFSTYSVELNEVLKLGHLCLVSRFLNSHPDPFGCHGTPGCLQVTGVRSLSPMVAPCMTAGLCCALYTEASIRYPTRVLSSPLELSPCHLQSQLRSVHLTGDSLSSYVELVPLGHCLVPASCISEPSRFPQPLALRTLGRSRVPCLPVPNGLRVWCPVVQCWVMALVKQQ